MKIPNIKGQPITVEHIPGEYPHFTGSTPTLTMHVRQPTPDDLTAIKQASTKASPETIMRFRQAQMPTRKRSDPPTICHYPPFKLGDLGFLFPIMEVEDIIVGFARQNYVKAQNLPEYKVQDPDDTLAECSLLILDPYQHRGLGTLYGQINLALTKYLGAQWLVGTTYTRDGFLKIRLRDGFQVVSTHGNNQVSIRKRL